MIFIDEPLQAWCTKRVRDADEGLSATQVQGMAIAMAAAVTAARVDDPACVAACAGSWRGNVDCQTKAPRQ